MATSVAKCAATLHHEEVCETFLVPNAKRRRRPHILNSVPPHIPDSIMLLCPARVLRALCRRPLFDCAIQTTTPRASEHRESSLKNKTAGRRKRHHPSPITSSPFIAIASSDTNRKRRPIEEATGKQSRVESSQVRLHSWYVFCPCRHSNIFRLSREVNRSNPTHF